MSVNSKRGSLDNAELDELNAEGPNAHPRDLAAFFICGLINNFAYVVMLSAALDLLKGSGGNTAQLASLVLLCDILPSFLVQFGAPWYMQRLPYWLRIHLVFVFMTASFLLPAIFESIFLRLLGVVFASLASGFGEITFLALSARYHRNTVSAFSSGTGGAGVAGAFSYQALRYFFTASTTLYMCAPVPVLIELSYFLLMTTPSGAGNTSKNPIVADLDAQEETRSHGSFSGMPSSGSFTARDGKRQRKLGQQGISFNGGVGISQGSGDSMQDPLLEHDGLDDDYDDESLDGAQGGSGGTGLEVQDKLTIREKIQFMPRLFKYMIPLFIVYFSEYLINQGVAPILYWPKGPLSKDSTYMAIQTVYQVGVFISRSSVNILPLRNLWIPAIAQFVNLVVLSCIAIFNLVPNVWIALAIILWEGLMGGTIYVNAFYQISQVFSGAEKEYAMGATSMSYATSITLAAVAGLGWTPFLATRREVFMKSHHWSWN